MRTARIVQLAVWVLGLVSACPARAAVDVEARLTSSAIETGGTVQMLVEISDPRGAVPDPQFALPAGLELLGSSRSQQMSWVNGRSTNVITFRFEIGASKAGRYQLGPIRVQVGGQAFRSGEMPLVVTDSAPSTRVTPSRGRRGGANDVASLVVTLEPTVPIVGQACLLKVQLIQRVDMSEDSDYAPPATPGFWSESWGDASTFRGHEGRREVLVIERALRLYPLAPGPAIIGPAHAMVSPSSGGLLDPFGGLTASRVELASESLRISVRPLPPDAPREFGGGVGDFEVSWNTDREHTTQDQAITARLDVRGTGNLPMMRAPAYSPADFEVFASTVEDSLPRPGTLGVGRRRFLWTLLPKRPGRLRASAPVTAWYDPHAGRYVTSSPGELLVEVLSAKAGAAGEDADGVPAVFRTNPSRPGGHAAWPPLALAGGLLVWAALVSWERSRAPDPNAAERGRLREWLRSIGLAHGPDFWRAADDASNWLHARGEQVLRLREAIAAARFGGRTDQEEDVRRRLVERLGASIPPPPARWSWQLGALVSFVLAVTLAALSMPRPGPEKLAERADTADADARAGQVAVAEAAWAQLWNENPGDPALAARLAWSALQRDDVAVATVWVVRGDRQEARDAALGAMAQRVRDAGGMVGAPGRALPLKSWEWGLLAFLLASAAGLARVRRGLSIGLGVAAVVAGLWWPVETAVRGMQQLAVVRASIPLPPGDVMLEPGQVVRVRKRASGEVTVRAASELEGTLPEGAFWFPGTR